jgi:LysM repeat protein
MNLKEIGLAITMLFNSAVGPTNQPMDERAQLDLIKTEIKKLEREIEWIDATDGDYAAKWLKIDKIKKNVDDKKQKLTQIQKLVNLRNKWAKEDSLELLKKYPPIKIEKQMNVVDTVYIKKTVSVIEKPIITYDTIVIEPKKTVPVYVQKIYTVQPNETLMGIAKNFNIRFSQLVSWNRLPMTYKVKAGERIKLVP